MGVYTAELLKRAKDTLKNKGTIEVVKKGFGLIAKNVKGLIYVYLLGQKRVEFKGEVAVFRVSNMRQYERATGIKSRVLNTLLGEIEESDIFYDIGANVGQVSCFVGSRLADGEVIAFEPDPANANVLRENLKQSGVSGTVYEYALANEKSTIEFLVPETGLEPGLSNAIAPEQQSSKYWDRLNNSISVDARRGDRLVESLELPVPNVVKIDIEGAELHAIRGLENTLARNECRIVLCEVHDYLLEDYGSTAEELEEKLIDLGFSINRFHERDYRHSRGEDVLLYKLIGRK